MINLSSFKKNTGLLIRIDDIASNMKWDLFQKCETLFDELNIKPLLGVIPNNKDKEFLRYEKKDDFWDGRQKNGDIVKGSYVYRVDYYTEKNELLTQKGSFILIK